MAQRFTDAEWDRIEAALEAEPERFGLPEGGREASLVLASFNIRKLGRPAGRERELDFLARFCARCDLVAIQEVQDDLAGLRHLKARIEDRIAGDGEFGLIVSDITGEVPGEPGMAERLAFLYRWRRIRRTDLASDLTIDRTSVLQNVFEHEAALIAARRAFEAQMERFAKKQRKTKPSFAPPEFVTFVRSPHVVAFEVPAANGQPPLAFTAVNAHLVFGTQAERRLEFEALLAWLILRLKSRDRVFSPNFILLGDLNLDFDQPLKDRAVIDARIRALNAEAFGDPDERRVYFPFIDEHPRLKRVLRSNARNDETFDQIGFFIGTETRRLPNDEWRPLAAAPDPDGYDYGVFNFAELFARVLLGKAYATLSKTERARFGARFEHAVSDHLPIWVRLPRPGFRPPPEPPGRHDAAGFAVGVSPRLRRFLRSLLD